MTSFIARRELLRRLAILGVAGAVGCRKEGGSPAPFVLSRDDDEFLDSLERASFAFFEDCTHPHTGLVKDRSLADRNDDREIASIAATCFGLTALCIADNRGWISHERARERVHRTLSFLFD